MSLSAFNPQQEVQVKRIQRVTAELEAELGLDGFIQIKHVFDAGLDGDHITPNEDPTLFGTCAITTPKWQYRFAQVRWFLPMVALIDDDMLEQTAIHEYVHILLHPLSQLVTAKDVSVREEYCAESICRMICHARGMKDIR